MRTAVPVDVRGGSPKSPQTNHWKRTDGACKYTSSYWCCYPYLEVHRAALAAATPITYHSRELLLVIHEHLQASGSSTTTAQLIKEAQLTPLPSLAASSSLVHQASSQETPSMQLQWPSGRIAGEFLSNKWKPNTKDEDSCLKFDSPVSSSKKKPLVFSATWCFLIHRLASPSWSETYWRNEFLVLGILFPTKYCPMLDMGSIRFWRMLVMLKLGVTWNAFTNALREMWDVPRLWHLGLAQSS